MVNMEMSLNEYLQTTQHVKKDEIRKVGVHGIGTYHGPTPAPDT
jgi:hypothetical protein